MHLEDGESVRPQLHAVNWSLKYAKKNGGHPLSNDRLKWKLGQVINHVIKSAWKKSSIADWESHPFFHSRKNRLSDHNLYVSNWHYDKISEKDHLIHLSVSVCSNTPRQGTSRVSVPPFTVLVLELITVYD